MASGTSWQPLFVTASFDADTAFVGRPITLRVIVLDVFGQEQEEARMSGEFHLGEV